MCSTPRSSGSVRKVHYLPSSKVYFKSYTKMMREASKIYDQKLAQHSKLKESENKNPDGSLIDNTPIPIAQEVAKKNYFRES